MTRVVVLGGSLGHRRQHPLKRGSCPPIPTDSVCPRKHGFLPCPSPVVPRGQGPPGFMDPTHPVVGPDCVCRSLLHPRVGQGRSSFSQDRTTVPTLGSRAPVVGEGHSCGVGVCDSTLDPNTKWESTKDPHLPCYKHFGRRLRSVCLSATTDVGRHWTRPLVESRPVGPPAELRVGSSRTQAWSPRPRGPDPLSGREGLFPGNKGNFHYPGTPGTPSSC